MTEGTRSRQVLAGEVRDGDKFVGITQFDAPDIAMLEA